MVLEVTGVAGIRFEPPGGAEERQGGACWREVSSGVRGAWGHKQVPACPDLLEGLLGGLCASGPAKPSLISALSNFRV